MRDKCTTHSVTKHWKKLVLVGLIGALVLLGTIISLHAEVYKWRDNTGIIQYSNKPPDDPSCILEQISTATAPPVEQPEGMMYYVNVPAPEILIPASQLPVEITALTLRLQEVEGTLDREVDNRVKWEEEYRQTQSLAKGLEDQNATLKLTVTRLEKKLKELNKAVVASDAQLTALKNPQPPQQLAMLEGKVDDFHGHLNTISQKSDQQVVMVQNELETIKSVQQRDLQTVYTKLDALESQLKNMPESARSENVTTLSAKLQELESALSTEISERESQQQPTDDIRVKLASLETEVEQLVDALPSARRASVVVNELVENGNVLKTIAASQGQQIIEQKAQIEALNAELEQLKTQTTPSIANVRVHSDSPNEVSAESLPDNVTRMIADLVEKNTLLEAVIKEQANALKTQNEHIKAIEARLAQLPVVGQVSEK
jgi:chromosome segregation ATPase